MLVIPDAAGPMDPAPTTPDRQVGSVRRTSSIDTARPDGLRGDLDVTARARDLCTGSDRSAELVAEAELHARVDGTTRQLLSIHSAPPLPKLNRLIGVVVGAGFRGRVADVVPDERDAGTLLHMLLDDLPSATLVSGHSLQRGGAFEEESGRTRATSAAASQAHAAAPGMRDDVCAGWAHDATIMVTIRTKGVIPMAIGPPAPILERVDDRWAWHLMESLPPHAMRRRRRLDVIPPTPSGTEYRVDAHFRDSHMDQDGVESVVHEYTVSGSVDSIGGRVTEMVAEARVLPWMECPGAVASAGRLVGMSPGELRMRVRRELTGASTCTHLNDTLRSLGDLPTLVPMLSRRGASGSGIR